MHAGSSLQRLPLLLLVAVATAGVLVRAGYCCDADVGDAVCCGCESDGGYDGGQLVPVTCRPGMVCEQNMGGCVTGYTSSMSSDTSFGIGVGLGFGCASILGFAFWMICCRKTSSTEPDEAAPLTSATPVIGTVLNA
jgi:hypothetical protein